jgi:hypothetical protein
MGNQPLIVASGVEQGVGKDAESGGVQRASGHLPLLVDAFCEAADGAIVPDEDGGG